MVPGYGGGMSSAKAQLESDTKVLSWEAGRKYGVRVNTIHPGFIFTGMTEGRLQRNDFRDWALKRTPIGRISEAQDIANGVLYLASDESSFVTGTELVIDGGFLAI